MRKRPLAGQSEREPVLPTPPRVLVYADELDRIGRWVSDFRDLETGGDLFGFFTHTGQPVIQYVLGPGPLARRSAMSFFQDRAFLVDAGKRLRDAHGLQHIGEWHSHHALGLARPSGGDVSTVVRAVADVGLERFLLVIANLSDADGEPSPSGRPHLRGFLFRGDAGPRYEPCAWVTLDGESPMRADHRLDELWDVTRPRSPSVPVLAVPVTTLDGQPSAAAPLRAGSWIEREDGRRLLAEILDSLGAWAAVRMTPSPDGLIEVRITARDERWVLTFDADVTPGRASADLRREGALDGERCGASVDELLEIVRARILKDATTSANPPTTDDRLAEATPAETSSPADANPSADSPPPRSSTPAHRPRPAEPWSPAEIRARCQRASAWIVRSIRPPRPAPREPRRGRG